MKVRHRRRSKLLCVSETKAFTLVEVLIALAITVISLVPLLHLLVTSISMMDTAGCLSRATLIGKAKMAEVVGEGYPEIGTDNGNVENEGNEVVFGWQVSVTDALINELEEIGLSGLRQVNVAVTWREGLGQKEVLLSTYVSMDQVVTRTALEGKSIRHQ